MQGDALRIYNEIKKAVVGKDEVLEKIIIAFLAKGHILIDDIPGVGKTTMAMAFAKAMGCECNRMQFTPDVMPSDITGFSAFNVKTQEFEYKPGVCMCNILLADEINRTSSKTHSALLEVMEERKVTVDGVTRELPEPFLVIATQNPTGSIGTQLLPESQLDRFMIRLSLGYPSPQEEMQILKLKSAGDSLDKIMTITSEEEILGMQEAVENTFVHDAVYEYIIKLITATRKHDSIELGVSPRGTVALAAMAKAVAFCEGRDYVIPADVKKIFKDVVTHRIILTPKAKANKADASEISEQILAKTPVPRLKKQVGEK